MTADTPTLARPSLLYRAGFWRVGLAFARCIPRLVLSALAGGCVRLYWLLARRRREILVKNLEVVLHDRKLAEAAAFDTLKEFAQKLVDLWRFESGAAFGSWTGEWNGWSHFTTAHARGKGVLLVTPHLGNWEFGGAFLVEHGYQLLVLTQPEPDPRLTELRQTSRTQRGVETLVVGEDAFAFVEIIKQLQAGKTVALLIDRPPAPTAVTVELFGHPFLASIGAAELARASGCAIVPAYIIREDHSYVARLLPEITYDRANIGTRAGRIQLTQQIVDSLQPAIRQHLTQWFHFVPIWPKAAPAKAPNPLTT